MYYGSLKLNRDCINIEKTSTAQSIIAFFSLVLSWGATKNCPKRFSRSFLSFTKAGQCQLVLVFCYIAPSVEQQESQIGDLGNWNRLDVSFNRMQESHHYLEPGIKRNVCESQIPYL